MQFIKLPPSCGKTFEFLRVSRRWQKCSLFQFMRHSCSSMPKSNGSVSGYNYKYECKYTFSGYHGLHSNTVGQTSLGNYFLREEMIRIKKCILALDEKADGRTTAHGLAPCPCTSHGFHEPPSFTTPMAHLPSLHYSLQLCTHIPESTVTRGLPTKPRKLEIPYCNKF